MGEIWGAGSRIRRAVRPKNALIGFRLPILAFTFAGRRPESESNFFECLWGITVSRAAAAAAINGETRPNADLIAAQSHPQFHNYGQLNDYLLAEHSAFAPPDGLIDIHYELELVHILGIDELKQTMTVLVYIDEKWSDESLSWDPLDFGGLNKTWIPITKIWKPDIIIINMLQHDDLLSDVSAPVLIYANGTVEASHPAVYTVSCEINIKHFPLDDQKCALEIASWAYNEEKIHLRPHLEHNLQHYTPNEEWKLLNVNVVEKHYDHEGITVSELYYEVSVRRKPLFYFITVTIPSYVMCALTVIGVFARASTTSERIERFTLGTMAVITSTSTAVLSLVVSEKVPHSSTAIPLLVAYFLYNMIVLTIAVILTSVILRVHRKGRFGREPSDSVMKFFLLKQKPKRHHLVENGATDSPTATNNNENDNKECQWTEDVVRAHRRLSPITVDSVLHRKLMVMENVMNKLCDIWQDTQTKRSHEFSYDQCMDERYSAENNGYVRIAERLDWIFMISALTALTMPVIYLYIYL